MFRYTKVIGHRPLLKFFVCQRLFRTNKNLLVRRVVNVRHTNVVPSPDALVKKSIVDMHAFESNENFYGIDGDEGVIFVQKNENKLETVDKNAIDEGNVPTEILYPTVFGVIRCDNENQVKYHGQFENESEIIRKKDKNKKLKSLNTQSPVLTEDHSTGVVSKQTESKNSLAMEKSMFCQNTEHDSHSVWSENENCERNQSVSFIDETYFQENLIEKDSNNIKSTTDNNNFSKEMLLEDNTKEKSHTASFSSIQSKDVENTSTFSNKVDSNFIEEQYFQNISKSSSETNLDPILLESPNSKFSSFIEETNNIVHFSSKDSAKASIKRENSTFDSAKNISSDLFKKNVSTYNETLLDGSQLIETQNDRGKFDSSNEQINESLQNKSYQPIVDQNLKNVSQFKFNLLDQLKNCGKINSTTHMPLKKNAQFVPKDNFEENFDIVKNSNKSEPNFPLKSNQSVTLKKEHSQEEIKTAHDFAMKLRAEKKTFHSFIQKGRIVIPKEKIFDSKGFRILENQVPNFIHCSNDEILQLLQNRILYLDENLMVLNKPYNIVIHDSKSTTEPCLSEFLDDLAKELDKKNSSPKLFTVHRIDKETTGCLLLARNELMAQTLKSFFAQRKILKTYWIICTKVPDPREGIIDIPIAEGFIKKKARMVLEPDVTDVNYKNHCKNGKRAVTKYKVLSELHNAALVEVKPETGIKHQIRVHFGFGLSCPILGDHKYSHLDKLAPQKLQADILQKLHVQQSKVRHIPMHIHAQSIIIPEYFTNRSFYISAPLPEHMRNTMKALKLKI